MPNRRDLMTVGGFLLVWLGLNLMIAEPNTGGDTIVGTSVRGERFHPVVTPTVNLHECTGPDGMVGHGFWVIKWAVEAWAAENNYQLNIVRSTHNESRTMTSTADYEIQYYGVGGKLRCDFPFKTFKIAVAGEVFEGNRPCQGATLILDRVSNRVHKGCPTVHYYQALQLPHSKGFNLKDYPQLCGDPPKANLNRAEGPILTVTEVFKRVYDHADAVVRSTILGLLARRGHRVAAGSRLHNLVRNYTRVSCLGSDVKSYECKSKFLFDLEMENTSEPGYISEKLVVGMMAGSIPVYWGDTDMNTAGHVFNPKRFIHCNDLINLDFIRQFDREVASRRKDKQKTQKDLHEWAMDTWGSQLSKCVDRIEQVMNNKLTQGEILAEPGLRQWVCDQPIPNGFTSGNISLYIKNGPGG